MIKLKYKAYIFIAKSNLSPTESPLYTSDINKILILHENQSSPSIPEVAVFVNYTNIIIGIIAYKSNYIVVVLLDGWICPTVAGVLCRWWIDFGGAGSD